MGAVVRFYNLGLIPNGLTTDEADTGYNAYSILKTHKDVYGRQFPLFFQSFNDYKPGIVTYLQIPFVFFLGLTDFSVRLLPAILGTLVPLLIYLLVRHMYPKDTNLPLVAMVLSSLAPWQIAISRAEPGFTLFLFLYLLFFISFYLALNKNIKFLIISALILAVSFYAYYASVIYAPLIIIILLFIYFGKLKKNIKVLGLSALVFVTVSALALSNFSDKQGRSRINSINIFTGDVTLPVSISEIQHDFLTGNPLAGVVHNRRFIYANAFLDNYFDFFNVDYLFVNSARVRYFYLNYIGLFYIIELPFVLYGLSILIRRKERSDYVVLALLLIGPIPGAIVLGAAYPHRNLILPLVIQIISAIGISTFLNKPLLNKTFIFKKWIVALYLIFVAFFLHQYFIHSPLEFNNESNNGAWLSTEVKKAIPLTHAYETKYDKIIFSWYVSKLAPAVYFMFYEKADPQFFQTKASGWTNEPPSFKQIYNQIRNIEFRPINWKEDQNLTNTLLIGYPTEFPKDVETIVDKTYNNNGQVQFIFVDPKKNNNDNN